MSRGLSRIQRAIVAALEQKPDGMTPSELVTELSRGGLFAAEGSYEEVAQDLFVVRRACWSLRRRDLVHCASPDATTTTLLGRSARTVWRAGGVLVAVRRAFAMLQATDAEIATLDAELAASRGAA